MKTLTYKINGYTSTYNPITEEVESQFCPAEVIVENPTNDELVKAKEIACNGEYFVTDDGQKAPETSEDIWNALLGVYE